MPTADTRPLDAADGAPMRPDDDDVRQHAAAILAKLYAATAGTICVSDDLADAVFHLQTRGRVSVRRDTRGLVLTLP